MEKKRVVITSLGSINPLATNVDEFWPKIQAGNNGISSLTELKRPALESPVGGIVSHFDPQDYGMTKNEIKGRARFTQFALIAADEAIQKSGIDFTKIDKDQVGVVLGVGLCGLDRVEHAIQTLEFEKKRIDELTNGVALMKLLPFTIPSLIPNSPVAEICMKYGFHGPSLSVSTACASSLTAIISSVEKIQLGKAKIMVTGGTEAVINLLSYVGFRSTTALSGIEDHTTASRPFDLHRDGFVMGEGSGIIIVEELEHAIDRGACIYAEIIGVGESSDAYHLVAPGKHAKVAMANAIRDADIDPESINYLNAHGTATKEGDVAEVNAIKDVFGEYAHKLHISSTKSMIGHLIGAAGAVELIATILAMQNDCVPPTTNFITPDPLCYLEYIKNHPQKVDIAIAMKNSFGFGGHNASIILQKYLDWEILK